MQCRPSDPTRNMGLHLFCRHGDYFSLLLLRFFVSGRMVCKQHQLEPQSDRDVLLGGIGPTRFVSTVLVPPDLRDFPVTRLYRCWIVAPLWSARASPALGLPLLASPPLRISGSRLPLPGSAALSIPGHYRPNNSRPASGARITTSFCATACALPRDKTRQHMMRSIQATRRLTPSRFAGMCALGTNFQGTLPLTQLRHCLALEDRSMATPHRRLRHLGTTWIGGTSGAPISGFKPDSAPARPNHYATSAAWM